MAASARSDVGRKSRAFSAPLRLPLYTQIMRTIDLSAARSAAPQPMRSSAMACLRVRGSVDAAQAAKAHP
eukprot:2631863-Pleurochrysis_carterae.AAC.1